MRVYHSKRECSIDAEAEGKATTLRKATQSIGCCESESDHTHRCFPTAIASSVRDISPSPVAPQVATEDGAQQKNCLGGPVSVGGPPTATDTVGNIIRTVDNKMKAMTTLQESEKVTLYNRHNDMTDLRAQESIRGTVVKHRATQKERAAGEAAETEATGSSAADRVEADIADSAHKTLRKKAKRLVKRLKADINAERSDRDEFVWDGMAVTGSNMMNLVNDVL